MQRIAEFAKVSKEQFFEQAVTGETDVQAAETAYNTLKLPVRATSGSAGYDFYLPFPITLEPGQTVSIPTGIRTRIDEGWVLMIFPKSGLGCRFRLQLDNTVGIIDSDYYNSDNEGHILIKMTNCSLTGNSDSDGGGKTITLAAGKAFAQGVFLPFGITYDDSADGVRNGGFGSTQV